MVVYKQIYKVYALSVNNAIFINYITNVILINHMDQTRSLIISHYLLVLMIVVFFLSELQYLSDINLGKRLSGF